MDPDPNLQIISDPDAQHCFFYPELEPELEPEPRAISQFGSDHVKIIRLRFRIR
jgi:hypothetical protein